MYNYIKIRQILLCTTLLLLSACAQQGFPSGGPKDTQPPVVRSLSPANGSTQFAQKQFYIGFDEYVQVKDASNNILVSPPMKHKPEYTPKGKGLLVKINDTLRENTTYLFQFRGGIVDFNEGNPLPVFNYVFSTGSSIDSMTLCGKVLEAFSAEPYKEPVTLLAYADSAWSDSIVVLQPPLYITRCDKKGFFQFCNMRAGTYRILALEDGDHNLLLGPDEAAAFLDAAVTAQHMPSADTTKPAVVLDTLQLSLSAPNHEKQRIEKSEMPGKGRAQIVSHLPMSNPVVALSSSPVVSALNHSRDTLTLWTLDADCDSLRLIITDSGSFSDTLTLRFTERKQKGPLANRKKADFPKHLPSGRRDYFDTLWLRFDNPADFSETASPDSLVQVLDLSDSSISRCGMAWDSTKLNARICFEGKPGGKYRFHIAEKQFADRWGHSNDSLDFSVEFTPTEEYGSLVLNIAYADYPAPLIVQLIDEKDNALVQKIVTHDCRLDFPHLKPGKYRFRAIWDSDGNGEWTPGDYWQHQQPEKVLYYSKQLELRNNWEIEETWSF